MDRMDHGPHGRPVPITYGHCEGSVSLWPVGPTGTAAERGFARLGTLFHVEHPLRDAVAPTACASPHPPRQSSSPRSDSGHSC